MKQRKIFIWEIRFVVALCSYTNCPSDAPIDGWGERREERPTLLRLSIGSRRFYKNVSLSFQISTLWSFMERNFNFYFFFAKASLLCWQIEIVFNNLGPLCTVALPIIILKPMFLNFFWRNGHLEKSQHAYNIYVKNQNCEGSWLA